jgi:Skp family chaperone for outer membrane proteins
MGVVASAVSSGTASTALSAAHPESPAISTDALIAVYSQQQKQAQQTLQQIHSQAQGEKNTHEKEIAELRSQASKDKRELKEAREQLAAALEEAREQSNVHELGEEFRDACEGLREQLKTSKAKEQSLWKVIEDLEAEGRKDRYANAVDSTLH